MKEKLKKTYEAVGLPRLLIICFFLALLLSSGSLELSIPSLLGDTVRRWVMYGILVLAMVPAVQCGIGLNFGVSLGIVGGLLGATIAIELEFANPWISLAVAMVVGTAIATVFGMGYGLLLNRVKGSEMTVSTYVGFSTIAFMNIVWLSLPYKNGEMIWPLGGAGLRLAGRSLPGSRRLGCLGLDHIRAGLQPGKGRLGFLFRRAGNILRAGISHVL